MDKIIPLFDRSQQVDDLKEIHFQSLSWNEGDFEKEDSDILQYEIYISGVNKLGQSVSVRVLGFTPYFYVQVPDSWTKREAELFYKHIKGKLWNNGYGLVGFDLVKRKKIYPYLAGRQFKFVRLIFSTDTAFNKCKWMFTKKNQVEKPIKISGVDHVEYYEAFETNIKHLNRFCHILGIETTGWLKITKFEEDLEYTSAQINVVAYWKDIEYDPETKSIAPLSIFSWDIECRPENTEEFPNPEVPGDIIKQISVVLVKYGTTNKQSFIFTSSPCSNIKLCTSCGKAATHYDQIECENIVKKCSKECIKGCENEECKKKCGSTQWVDAVVVESDGEKKLLEKFCDFIGLVDPDILTGFNTWGFDDIYFWKRATVIHDIDISKLSRINQINPKLIKKELSSSAYGNNEFNYLFCPGRETFDMLVAIRREHKLESTSLNFVSKHFLKETKLDLPYRILFEKLNGGPDEIAECAAYCIQDSNLTVKLLLKLNMLPNYVEMAKATYVPMEWLLFRGQQCKVFSLIAKDAREAKYVIPVYEKTDKGQKFQGATVINPMIGMYYDPIAGLDFASLYPSIMMAYNMCYSTIIASKDMMDYVIANNIPYKTVEWESCTEKDCKNPDCHHERQKHSFSFVQIEDEKGQEISNGVRGLLGTILMRLMQGRKATKKLMKTEKDPFMNAVLNGKQLAQKVTMNSVYGFTGAENGILPLKPIASSVTATGRKMIDKTSKMAGEQFGAITIYGDSIPGYEKITVSKKEPGRSNLHFCLGIHDIPISEFAEKVAVDWQEYRGFKVNDITIKNKEYKDLENEQYYTKTHEGFQKIKKVIRHSTNKKLYKIKARDSDGKIHEVVVTEGHSLILANKRKVAAQDLIIGSSLYDYRD
jgi:DNA polymerase delta subunit 1